MPLDVGQVAATGPADPATVLFILAGLFGVAAMYFAALTYTRGGRDVRGNIWAYGLVGALLLSINASYITFSRVGALPDIDLVHAALVSMTSLFLMLMFKDSTEFFG